MTHVIVYSRKTGCPACKAMKEYLARKHPNVKYVEEFPDEDINAMQHVMAMRSKSVPVLAVYGDEGLKVKVDGFNPSKIDAALAGL